MARHLLDLGHRRFGIVTRPGREDPSGTWRGSAPRIGLRQRVDGFTQAVRDAGLPDAAITVVSADANTQESGARAAAALLVGAERTRATAIFGVTDVLALGVLDAAKAALQPVPAALSVVGFDDIVAARQSRPSLTTVEQSLYEQGVHAARIALALIAGRTAHSPRIRAELIVRDSTARPPSTRRRST